ncbi:MAG: PAS domain-containing protein, partial [Limisphaerales bacterium]
MNSPLNQLLTAEDILDTVREPLVVLDADLRVMMANQSFYQSFRVTPENTQGQLLYDLGDRQWDIPALRKLLEEVLPQNAVFNDYEVDHTFPDIGHRMMLLNARRLDHSKLILLAIKDVTERKQGEGELRRSNARNELILAGTEAATWDWNIPDKRVLFSRRWKQLRGFSEAEVGDSEVEWSDRIHPDDKVRVLEAVAAHLAGQTPLFDEEYRVRHKSGHWIWILDRGV